MKKSGYGWKRINYPSHRKSPYRHRVRAHKRQGRPVRSYMRGKGPRPSINPRVRLRRKPAGKGKGNSFNVTIEYTDYSRESLTVSAPNYPSALDKSIVERRQIKPPLSILLRKS